MYPKYLCHSMHSVHFVAVIEWHLKILEFKLSNKSLQRTKKPRLLWHHTQCSNRSSWAPALREQLSSPPPGSQTSEQHKCVAPTLQLALAWLLNGSSQFDNKKLLNPITQDAPWPGPSRPISCYFHKHLPCQTHRGSTHRYRSSVLFLSAQTTVLSAPCTFSGLISILQDSI